MRALGSGDLLALVGLDLAQDIGHRGLPGQPLETAISCFSRAAAAPLSSDLVPSTTPSFKFFARPATISAAAAFSSATSRKGLGIPWSTLCSAIARSEERRVGKEC